MKYCYIVIIISFFFVSHLKSQDANDTRLNQLWAPALEHIGKEEFKEAIPDLKKVSDYTRQKKHDYFWAASNVLIAYCFLVEDDLDSLGYYGKIVEEKVDQFSLSPEEDWNINADYSFLLGKYYYEKGWYEQAISYYQKSIDILLGTAGVDKNGIINYALIGNYFSMNTPDLFNDAALAYYTLGDFDKSIKYYRIAIEVESLKQGQSTESIENMRRLCNLGLAYLSVGNLKEAAHFLKKSESIPTNPDDPFEQETLGLIYKNWAYYHHLNQKQDSCIYYINKSLDTNTKDEFKIKTHHIHLMSLKDDDSETLIETVFDSLTNIAQNSIGYYHPDMAKSFKLKADIYSYQKKYDKADQLYNTAINILKGIKNKNCNCKNISVTDLNDKRLAMETIHNKAKNLSESAQNEKALDCFYLLQEIISELQQKYILNEESKYLLVEKTKTMYEDAIKTAISAGDKESAYRFSQSSRSMVLLQQVQEKTAIQATNIPKFILKEGYDLKLSINEYQKKREAALLNRTNLEEWDKAIFSQNKLYENWKNKLEKEYPNYFQLKYELPETSIKEIKQNLRNTESTLIEYFVGKENIYIFILDKNGIKTDVQKINNSFLKNIQIISKNISEFNYDLSTFNQYHQSSFYLYNLLLEKPINNNWIKNENLIIIPDESLNLIPFEALITKPYESKNETPQYSRLDYMLNEYNISYLHSSHLIKNNKANIISNKFLGIAPSFANPKIPPLENNGIEIQNINQLYQGEILEKDNATYDNFMKKIGNCNIAHFATHAIFNDKIPMDSRIELSDTSLYIYEIFSLEHQLQLAVMSACQTASGKKKKGEGVISLSRAFIQSGCPSVVASLWDVSDQKASDLLNYFHQNLIIESERKDVALANAKRKYFSESINMNAHPFFWAGIIQIGNTDPISSTPNNSWYWIITASLLGILFLWFVRNIKNK